MFCRSDRDEANFYVLTFQVFSRYNEINSFCLGHLFTHQTFDRGGSTVLGLAYIASPRPYAHGGICTPG